jgi:hypothetical protein
VEGTSLDWTSREASVILICLLTVAATWQLLAKDRYPFGKTIQTPEIVSDLENAIGAPANKTLNGRLLNLMGTAGRDPNGLLFWIKVVINDMRYQTEFGNDFRTYGAWGLNIPTVLQYNQVMSPTYYYVASRAFARPGDQRIRSLLMMSRIDIKWLRILGVRYVLSDVPFADANLRLVKSYPVSSSPDQPILLYEVGGWRPFTSMPEPGADNVVAEMKTERDAGLAPQDDAGIIVEIRERGITINKRTGGTSFIAVPVIYSHCFSVLERSNEGSVSLFPAYGATLGLSLSGRGTFRLQYRNGPFDNSWCRLKDWQDAKKTFTFDPEWVADDRLFEVQ